jgi:hypothetical protein
MSDYDLVQEVNGRFYDSRLGSLIDEMYVFADESGMQLNPRYDGQATWQFSWSEHGLERHIDAIISERTFIELHIHSGAFRDDAESGKRHFTRKPKRGYMLFLPIAKATLRETLEMALRDARVISEADLEEGL